MFKIARVNTDSLKEAKALMEKVRAEAPSHWPYGLSAEHFDGGLYLIREKAASTPVGFCGFQRRLELQGDRPSVTGYYSIGILPEFRNNGYAKEAVSKLLALKSDSVDQMKAMIVAGNVPSLRLADSLGVEKIVKSASYLNPKNILENPGQLLHSNPIPHALDPSTVLEHPGSLLDAPSQTAGSGPAPISLYGKKIRIVEDLLKDVGIDPKKILPHIV